MKPDLRMLLPTVFLALACGEGTGVEDGRAIGVARQGARDRQGTTLQGGSQELAYADLPLAGRPRPSDPVAADGRPFLAVDVAYANLKGTTAVGDYKGEDLAGAVFYGKNQRTGSDLKFHISKVHPRPAGAALPGYDYEVLISDSAGASDVPLCAGANLAVPVPGTWDVYGAFTGWTDRFSFVCPEGVVDKCIRWGYRFWEPGYAEFHLACTKMARADYCGRGDSHTLDGTLIDFYDVHGVRGLPGYVDRDPASKDMVFEAAWRTKGQAVCLSKLRWSTLPLGGFCPSVLPDPRVVSMKQDPRARFCEDYGKVGTLDLLSILEREGAIVFNDSAYMDAGLYTWTHSSTGERLTSSHGSYAPARRSVPPDPTNPDYGSARFEGTVYNPGLAPALLPAGTLPLHRWYHSGRAEYLTTTVDPVSLGAGSGYVRGPSRGPHSRAHMGGPPGARKLVIFRNTATGDFLTTTGVPPAGYEGFAPKGGCCSSSAQSECSARRTAHAWDRVSESGMKMDVPADVPDTQSEPAGQLAPAALRGEQPLPPALAPGQHARSPSESPCGCVNG